METVARYEDGELYWLGSDGEPMWRSRESMLKLKERFERADDWFKPAAREYARQIGEAVKLYDEDQPIEEGIST